MKTRKQEYLESVLHGAWGTIAPRSFAAARILAEKIGAAHGLLVHSASAALEIQLRSLEIGYGDEVIVASYSDPIDSMTAAAVGATPVFADIDGTGGLSPAAAEAAVTGRTRAVIADAPGGNPCDAAALADLCARKGLKLILNADDGYITAQNGRPVSAYAYGVVMSIADGRILSGGEGGFVANNDERAYSANFAYHNCGRPPGAGSTLDMDDILGGNLRIADWQAAAVEAEAEELDALLAARAARADTLRRELAGDCLTPVDLLPGGVSSCSAVIFRYDERAGGKPAAAMTAALCADGHRAAMPWKAMHSQPVFASPYFRKLTGCERACAAMDLPQSAAASASWIWVYA